MKLINFKNMQLFAVIILLGMYHFYIHSRLEKSFSQTYFDYDAVKRPRLKCQGPENSSNLKCIGMPSSHMETASVVSFLLYFNKIIPLWVCLLIIYTVSMQRLITDMHSLSQVMVGAILGYIYAFLYTKFTF
jgi:membrane-associated phospholipid phosphatase